MYSSVTAQLTPQSHFCPFTPLHFTSFSPVHISLSLLWLPVSLPRWEERNSDSSSASDGALTGWFLCPLPRACSCARALRRLPPQTHIHTETARIHLPTHMHAYIYRSTEGAHMCTQLLHTHSTCACVFLELYISPHISMLHPGYAAAITGYRSVWPDTNISIQVQLIFPVFYVCVLLQRFAEQVWHLPTTSFVDLNIILHSVLNKFDI